MTRREGLPPELEATAPIEGLRERTDASTEPHDTLRDPGKDRPRASVPPGYRFADVIGRGGMGEVVLAEDLQLEREVAIKSMLSASPSADAVARFLREAKIQARLDHPAIVPVHELGRGADGRPYFAMKRVTGMTLDRLIADGAPQQKLLRAFVDVCLAIDLAHARGVIHRDLKPSNVMLGDYGEVYVLDWGVARITGERDSRPAQSDSRDGETQAGAILGTLGYMSPEQMRGEPVTPATDIYALGAILYEILTGVPAHPRGEAAMASTMMGVEPPLQRTPERPIPPELDSACMNAMSMLPADRPTARELADEVQRYLDGDRDVERRRALAAAQLADARRALASDEPAERIRALVAAGRALALDPESKDAAALVSRLMLEPPRELPPDLVARLAEVDRESMGRQSGFAARAMASYFLFIPLLLWSGVKTWSLFVAIYGIVVITIVGSVVMARRRSASIIWAVVAQSAVLVLITRVLSPVLITPGLACSVAVAMLAFPTLIDRPWIVIAGTLTGFVLPLVLESLELWPSTWGFEGGRLVITSDAIHMDGFPAAALIVTANIAIVIVMSVLARSVAATQRAGQRALEIQAWRLGHLLPVERPSPHSSGSASPDPIRLRI